MISLTLDATHRELDEHYAPIIKSYHLPDTPPPAPVKPKKLSPAWFSNLRFPLPPALQFKFPYNIVSPQQISGERYI